MLLCSTEYEHEIVLNSINDSTTEKVNKGTINVLDGLSYKYDSEDLGIDNPTSDTPLNVEWTITQKNKPFQIEYTTSDNKILILSSSENKVITSVMDSHTYSNGKGVILFSDVPEIGYYAFAYADEKNETNKLISIIIPEGVTEIAFAAFEQCFSLTTVTIPNSVIKIESPFMQCSKLKTINYNGTIAQWNAIRKINWNWGASTTC